MFTVTTNDPDKKPLPSFKLLELQWILQRVVAMSGICCESSFDYSSDRVYDWIPPPQSLYSSPDVAKVAIELRNTDPRGVFYEEHLHSSTVADLLNGNSSHHIRKCISLVMIVDSIITLIAEVIPK